MKKKLSAMILALIMMGQTAGFVSVSSANSLYDGIYVKDGFEGETAPFSTTSKYIEHGVAVDGDGERIYEIVNTGSGPETTATLSYKQVGFGEEEMQVVSFDIMIPKTDYCGNIILRTGGWAMIYSITGDGYITADWQRKTSGKDATYAFKYTPGEWYKLTAILKRNEGTIRLIKDNEDYGHLATGSIWPPSMTFVIETASGKEGVSSTVYLDNLIIGNDDAYTEAVNEHIGIECEELGQAFWGKTVDFGIRVKNTTDVSKTYSVTAELTNDLEENEYSATETVELAPRESRLLEYSANLSRYAVYDLRVTTEDAETSEVKIFNSELVTLKKSEEQNPKIGFHDHAADSGDGYGRIDDKYSFFKNAGIGALRGTFAWSVYEAKQGEYVVPDRYTKAFSLAKENNFDMLLVAGFNNKAVTDALGLDDEKPPYSEENIKAFGQYAYHMTEDTANSVYGYEAWNEWNVFDEGSFNADKIPGSAYVPFIKETYKQIKSANPNAKVYGLSGMTWNRKDLYKQMATEMFANGVADYCDGFSMHTYAHQGSPDDGVALECIDFTKGLMKQYNAEDKELIITEMGWQATTWEPETIASWAVKYSAMVHDKVDRIYWYCSQRKKRDVGNAEKSYGWMQDELEWNDYVAYAPLPQMRAISNYNSFIANTEKVAEISIPGSNAVMHRFEHSNGKDVIMAWVKDGDLKETHAINVGADKVTIADLYGNETEYTTVNGMLYVNLTNEPQYIVGNFDSDINSSQVMLTVLNKRDSIYVAGNMGLSNENLTFYVTKKGELCYLNQIKTDNEGNYELTFPLDKDYGFYNLSIGTKDNGKTSLNFSFDIEAFEIDITKDGAVVEDLDNLKGGDVLTFDMRSNIGNVQNSSAMVVQYNEDGILEEVKIVSDYTDKPFEVIVRNNTKSIKVLIWSMPDMQPLCNAFKL